MLKSTMTAKFLSEANKLTLSILEYFSASSGDDLSQLQIVAGLAARAETLRALAWRLDVTDKLEKEPQWELMKSSIATLESTYLALRTKAEKGLLVINNMISKNDPVAVQEAVYNLGLTAAFLPTATPCDEHDLVNEEIFRVYITKYHPNNKISVIKAIREITGEGLRESKNMSEAPLPSRILETRDYSAAVEASNTLDRAGAMCSITRNSTN